LDAFSGAPLPSPFVRERVFVFALAWWWQSSVAKRVARTRSYFVIAGHKARSAVLVANVAGYPCGASACRDLAAPLDSLRVGMDHRVKPGGDHEQGASRQEKE
jgi:hypothetical protein